MSGDAASTIDWTIKATDIAIVLATLLGPVLAVQAQKWLERNRETKQRRVAIFRTLMATRATSLSPAHVEALNAVPIEFYGNDEKLKAIVDKWKAYLNHLGQKAMAIEVWGPKRLELFVDLLHEMAGFLGYKFNQVEISNDIYSPEGHAKIETDQEIIRRGLALLLSGQFALPMVVKQFPFDPAAIKEQEELRQLLGKWLKGENAVPVEVRQSDHT